jgi:hypothetical protein
MLNLVLTGMRVMYCLCDVDVDEPFFLSKDHQNDDGGRWMKGCNVGKEWTDG